MINQPIATKGDANKINFLLPSQLDNDPPVGANIPQIQKIVANHDPIYSSISMPGSDSSCGNALVGYPKVAPYPRDPRHTIKEPYIYFIKKHFSNMLTKFQKDPKIQKSFEKFQKFKKASKSSKNSKKFKKFKKVQKIQKSSKNSKKASNLVI